MTRPSKREIEREVEGLQPSKSDDGVMIVIDQNHVQGGDKADLGPADWSASPHPMLSYKPFPEQKPYSLKVAIPHFLPEPWASERFLFVETCEGDDPHGVREEEGSGTVAACDLWDALSEEELKREARYRVEHDEPMVAALLPYVPE